MKRSFSPVSDIFCLLRLIAIFRKNKFEMIHSHCSKAAALSRIACLISKNRTVFYSPHCFAFNRCKNKITKKLCLITEKLLIPLTYKFIAVSRSDIASMRLMKIDPKKCLCIGNGLQAVIASQNPNKQQILSELKLPQNHTYVTTACRLEKYKGIFDLVRAAKLSAPTNTIFLIAGTGPLKKTLKRFIRKNDLADKIILLGNVSNIKKLLSITDIFILCSKAEALPYSILEAMQNKCPVIAVNSPGIRNLIKNDQTGILTKRNPQEIARAIDLLIKNQASRKTLADNAYNFVKENFSLDQQINTLSSFYRGCVTR